LRANNAENRRIVPEDTASGVRITAVRTYLEGCGPCRLRDAVTMPHGDAGVGRTAKLSSSKSSTGLKKSRTTTTTKLTVRGRPETAAVAGPLFAASAKKRGDAETNGNSVSPASPRSTRETVVWETAADVVQSKDSPTNDDSHVVDETIPLEEPTEKSQDEVSGEGGGLQETTTTAEADGEVRFVVPQRQQTSEEFDVRQFLVDVGQLAAGLQAVVDRGAAEDFEGDRLEEMVAAVVGSMNNFTTFVSRVYDLLETVREQMKSATDFMTQTVLQPTEWSYLTFKGWSRFALFCLLVTHNREQFNKLLRYQRRLATSSIDAE